MSAYDDAVAYLDVEVHPRCDYEIYSAMRDIVDEMEIENSKLRELVRDLVRLPAVPCFDCFGCRYERHHDCECGFKCVLVERAKRFGIEVE